MKKTIIIVGIIGIIATILITRADILNRVESYLNLGYGQYTPTLASASSTVQTVTTDVQLLASSTKRIYARVINNCATSVYLTTDADLPANTSNGFYLAPYGEWNTDTSNAFMYTGAVRASSTDETSCGIYVIEY